METKEKYSNEENYQKLVTDHKRDASPMLLTVLGWIVIFGAVIASISEGNAIYLSGSSLGFIFLGIAAVISSINRGITIKELRYEMLKNTNENN